MKIRYLGPAFFYQRAEFFFSQKILQMKAGQNNKYSGLKQVCLTLDLRRVLKG